MPFLSSFVFPGVFHYLFFFSLNIVVSALKYLNFSRFPVCCVQSCLSDIFLSETILSLTLNHWSKPVISGPAAQLLI
jgi:hypothetical protein